MVKRFSWQLRNREASHTVSQGLLKRKIELNDTQDVENVPRSRNFHIYFSIYREQAKGKR